LTQAIGIHWSEGKTIIHPKVAPNPQRKSTFMASLYSTCCFILYISHGKAVGTPHQILIVKLFFKWRRWTRFRMYTEGRFLSQQFDDET